VVFLFYGLEEFGGVFNYTGDEVVLADGQEFIGCVGSFEIRRLRGSFWFAAAGAAHLHDKPADDDGEHSRDGYKNSCESQPPQIYHTAGYANIMPVKVTSTEISVRTCGRTRGGISSINAVPHERQNCWSASTGAPQFGQFII
jgi:hypothetical protein